MNLNRLVITLLLCLSTAAIHADRAEDLRKSLPQLKGDALIQAYGELYACSLEGEDVDYQIKCVNDLIAESHRQGNHEKEGDARVQKMMLFYNVGINDSIYEQVHPTLDFLANIGDWKNYYETWTILIDAYNFAGKTIMGMDEAKTMFADAEHRKNDYGMGMGYYSMGNVYAMMHNYEEAADAYQKSVDLLMSRKPKPLQLADIFSYYAEVLEILNRYEKMNEVTNQWNAFLHEFYGGNKGIEATSCWAYYYLARAQAALGLDNLEEASKMLDEVRNRTNYEGGNLYKLWLFCRANLCLKQGFYDEALALNDQSTKYLDDDDDTSMLIRVKKQRAQIMEQLGRFREAAGLYNEIYTINDSINSHDTKSKLAEMNTKFDLGELRIKEERARTLYAIAIASIIVLALAIFTFFRMRSAKRLKVAHLKLEDAHGKLEETHQQLLTAYDQLEETTIAKERIESDLRIARDIQMSMVPSTFPERPDLDLYASMTPAKEVGGDLYGYHLIDDQLYFCLGDVSGKGVPASLFMAQATRLFRTLAAQKMMPAEIATRINDALSGEDNERGMFVTMFLGLVDLKTGHLDFCNAGHNPPVLVGDGKAEFIEMIPNAPIGLWPELPYEGEEIADITGKAFFVYSDGLNEAENRQQEQFSDERLVEILQTHPFESSRQTIEMLKAEVEAHRDGAEPNDDLTMLCLKVKK
jgi:serine phosphatase RsbU (regulator of sigma subunit)